MEQIYYNNLRTYFRDTAKLIQRAPRTADLLIDEARKKEEPSQLSEVDASVANRNGEQEIASKRRELILQNLTAQPIVAAIAQQKQIHYYFEEVFRSQNKLIVDTVCKEFVFVLEFFDLKMAHMSQLFNKIFARVVNKYLQWLKDYDALGI